MDRRDFMTRVPATVAGIAVGGAVGLAEAAGAGGGHEGVPEGRMAQGGSGGFVLVGVPEESVVAFATTFQFPEGSVLVHPTFSLRSYVVECAYPVGSKAWMAIADRDEEGALVVYDETDPDYVYLRAEKVRRVVFPRFVAEEGEGLRERAVAVYNAVCENGFDTASGHQHAWRVVHVEYRCPDGVEHVMCGMPLTWDPRLALGVMVKGQIA